MNLMTSSPILRKAAGLKLKAAFLNIVLLLDHPVVCFVVVFLGYLVFSAIKQYPFGVTPTAQYNFLADLSLHGQFTLRVVPPTVVDLVLYHSQYYVYYSPFPALLFLPFVAIFGVGFSDILATMVIGTLNVVLLLELLKLAEAHGLIQLSAIQRVLLTLTFAFGTTQLILATQGKIWFTGHIVTFACLAFTYWAVLRYRGGWAFFLAGLGMAGAFATRNNAVLVGIWPAWFLLKKTGICRARRCFAISCWAYPRSWWLGCSCWPITGSGLAPRWITAWHFTRWMLSFALCMRNMGS